MRIYLLVGCLSLACGSNETRQSTDFCDADLNGCQPSQVSNTSTSAGTTGHSSAGTSGPTSMADASVNTVTGTGSSTVTTGTTGASTSSVASVTGSTGAGGAGATNVTGTTAATSTTGGTPGAWHAAVATQVSEALLAQEYETWKNRYWQSCADGSSIVNKDGSVVSEGIAYGMLLAVNFNDRPVFDSLWQYYTDHLDANGLMNWATGLCDPPGNNNANAATDAELDAAMALVQAAAVWPDGGYLAAAEDLAQKILSYETDTCDGQLVLLPGDAWGGCNDNDTRINPSYFAPGYYRVFASKFAAQAEAWNELLENTYALYASYQALFPLAPDWDNHPYGDEASLDNYYYDACRTPWRVATDYAFSGDMRAATFLNNVSAWVDANGGIGSPGGRDNNSAFNGAFALSGVTDQAVLDAYVASWLSSGGDDNPYFQGTLRVLYLLLAGGRFPSTL